MTSSAPATDGAAEVVERGHLIEGAEIHSGSGQTFETLDPATGEPIARLAQGGPGDVDRAVRAARAVESEWAALDAEARGRMLMRLAELVESSAGELAVLESRN